MTAPNLPPAKASHASDESDAIVVSFDARWHSLLLARAFTLVIRKRVPKERTKRWLYFHINSPVAALCARAEITRIATITSSEAVRRTKDIGLSAEEIRSYIGDQGAIGCYALGGIELAKHPATVAILAEHLRYFPPQSFVVLSRGAKTTIDKLCGFNPLAERSGTSTNKDAP